MADTHNQISGPATNKENEINFIEAKIKSLSKEMIKEFKSN